MPCLRMDLAGQMMAPTTRAYSSELRTPLISRNEENNDFFAFLNPCTVDIYSTMQLDLALLLSTVQRSPLARSGQSAAGGREPVVRTSTYIRHTKRLEVNARTQKLVQIFHYVSMTSLSDIFPSSSAQFAVRPSARGGSEKKNCNISSSFSPNSHWQILCHITANRAQTKRPHRRNESHPNHEAIHRGIDGIAGRGIGTAHGRCLHAGELHRSWLFGIRHISSRGGKIPSPDHRYREQQQPADSWDQPVHVVRRGWIPRPGLQRRRRR